MSSTDKTLDIRGVKVWPPVALAPMVGLSHSAMRSLIVRLGGAGLFFTEMLAAKHLPHESTSSPFVIRTPEESPLFYQIYISDIQYAGIAAERLEQLGADGIDINLGCPAPQVRRSGAGGFLAENRKTVGDIARKLRKETSMPLTAKIRLGREINREKLRDFCSMLEAEGVNLISVHARLHGEKFCRLPRWQDAAVVKKSVKVPVFINGGIFSVEDARKALTLSGADGVMLGRGGMEKPLLFGEIAREVYGCDIDIPEMTPPDVYFSFANLLRERFRPERRLGRLKQYTHYFAASYNFGHHLASEVQKSKNMNEALLVAEKFFEKNEPGFIANQGACHDRTD